MLIHHAGSRRDPGGGRPRDCPGRRAARTCSSTGTAPRCPIKDAGAERPLGGRARHHRALPRRPPALRTNCRGRQLFQPAIDLADERVRGVADGSTRCSPRSRSYTDIDENPDTAAYFFPGGEPPCRWAILRDQPGVCGNVACGGRAWPRGVLHRPDRRGHRDTRRSRRRAPGTLTTERSGRLRGGAGGNRCAARSAAYRMCSVPPPSSGIAVLSDPRSGGAVRAAAAWPNDRGRLVAHSSTPCCSPMRTATTTWPTPISCEVPTAGTDGPTLLAGPGRRRARPLAAPHGPGDPGEVAATARRSSIVGRSGRHRRGGGYLAPVGAWTATVTPSRSPPRWSSPSVPSAWLPASSSTTN
jgi:hypothetical protein